MHIGELERAERVWKADPLNLIRVMPAEEAEHER